MFARLLLMTSIACYIVRTTCFIVGAQTSRFSLMKAQRRQSCEDVKTLKELKEEASGLEYMIQLYHAITQRNEAQIDSFVDSEAQWRAQSEEDRDILLGHAKVLERLVQVEDDIQALSKIAKGHDSKLLDEFNT